MSMPSESRFGLHLAHGSSGTNRRSMPRAVRHVTVLGSCLLAGMLSACSSSPPPVYFHPNADLSSIGRVAILPFSNYSSDRFASERVREVLAIEILSSQIFDVVPMGEVNRMLRSLQLETVDALTPEEIGNIGKGLNAQALFFGSVMEYRERRTGTITAPDVALSLYLVDVETGLTMWSTTDASTGLGVWTRLFGVGEKSQTEAVRDLLRTILPTLVASS